MLPFKNKIIINRVVDATMAPEVMLRIKIRRSKLWKFVSGWKDIGIMAYLDLELLLGRILNSSYPKQPAINKSFTPQVMAPTLKKIQSSQRREHGRSRSDGPCQMQ
jgi:hypothetical protein